MICGGVEKSSSPPTSRVSTFDVRTWLYSFSSGAAGQASTSRPPPQMYVVVVRPRFVPSSCPPEEK